MTSRRFLFLIALVAVVGGVWILFRGRTSPQPRDAGAASVSTLPPLPTDAVSPFHVGLSSLDVEENERAGRLFEMLSRELPDEPAVWANLGLARLRLGELPEAETALAKAAELAPDDPRIAVLQAIVDEVHGEFQRAIDRLNALPDPDPAVLYRLADLLNRTGADADPRAQLEILDRIRERDPENLVVAFDRARLLARLEDRPRLEEAIQGFVSQSDAWSPAATRQLATIQTALGAGNFRSVSSGLAFLQNLVTPTPAYQAGLTSLDQTGGSIGQPLRELLAYADPGMVVAPVDEGLTFTVEPAPDSSASTVLHVAQVLTADSAPTLLSFSPGRLEVGETAVLPWSDGTNAISRNSFCAADFNGDALQDLAINSGTGLALWIQGADGTFTAYQPNDDTHSALTRPGHGVWVLDYDAEGDLDLLVGRQGAAPYVLRNNGDGSFTAMDDALSSFPEVREMCWADFDGDGDGDLGLLDAGGRVLVSWNDRAGAFTTPEPVAGIIATALTSGDVDGLGQLSLVALKQDGAVTALSFDRTRKVWSTRDLARWQGQATLASAQARTALHLADLDNNGAVDLIASARTNTAIWLNAGEGRWHPLDGAPALFVMSIDDLDGDGLLDLVGVTGSGAATAMAAGTKDYHWQSIQARALASDADGRINSFGIGGRIEIRAGPLLAVAPIVSPRTHFGLGSNEHVGVARIVWPNGVAQVEFDLASDKQVTATQRLKGSCPWVFARGTDGFHFIKDFIWRSPLGMRINSQDTAGVEQTEDWILVPGDQVAVHEEAYEFRVTAELWETHFFDHITLRAVDRPSDVEVHVDERFVPTQQPKLEVIVTSPAQPFASVRDEAGRDMSARLAATDGETADTFPLGRYQGVAQDHWVEFQLPEDAPLDRSLVVIGKGWIYPTDSSLNVAISQGAHPPPQGLVLEAYDRESGAWRALSDDLGFPAGKNKTVVIPLPVPEGHDATHTRYRLRTNLEIYWDELAWATLVPDADVKIRTVEAVATELRHRGFSRLSAVDRRKPDLPIYDELIGTGPRWRDLEGYYTRYGDVAELLQEIDDRYVIMNAGDEFVLRYAALPPPPSGWTRDFVLIGDGWVKDGDFNTANSRTVHPLPSHAQREYESAPRPLESDPVFQRHREDWQRFHTRYVTPVDFEQGLMKSAHASRTRSTP